ncbi:hypothetical protein ACRQ5Q_15005 [Bradyrhizobium sp. PMVTL-01]|uniref:hypothetical protein n=1 Tax=Bradyrhizobium sp. PMVTL-01 TaxID=3434999 RepID=UPI003F6FD0DE
MSHDRCDACGALYAMVGLVHRCIPRPKPVEVRLAAEASKPKARPKVAKKKPAKRSKK